MRVLGARIIVKEEKLSEKTSNGILIPGRDKQSTNKGEVILVGDGAMLENGNKIPVGIKVGEKVLYTAFSGTPIVTSSKDSDTLVILNERDVLCVLD